MPTNNAIVSEIDKLINQERRLADQWTGLAVKNKSESTLYMNLARENNYAVTRLMNVRDFIQGKDKTDE